MPTVTFELSDIDALIVQNPALHIGAFCHGIVQRHIEEAKNLIVQAQIENCKKYEAPIPPTVDGIVFYAYNGEFGLLSQQYKDMLQRQFEAAAKAQAAADVEAYETQKAEGNTQEVKEA